MRRLQVAANAAAQAQARQRQAGGWEAPPASAPTPAPMGQAEGATAASSASQGERNAAVSLLQDTLGPKKRASDAASSWVTRAHVEPMSLTVACQECTTATFHLQMAANAEAKVEARQRQASGWEAQADAKARPRLNHRNSLRR